MSWAVRSPCCRKGLFRPRPCLRLEETPPRQAGGPGGGTGMWARLLISPGRGCMVTQGHPGGHTHHRDRKPLAVHLGTAKLPAPSPAPGLAWPGLRP